MNPSTHLQGGPPQQWSSQLHPRRPKGQLWTVDTSSQVSIKEAEASLEDIPAGISPIAAVSRTGSVSPPEDIMVLQTSANKAFNDLLTTKASIDACRWRVMKELNVALHQSKSKAAAPIKEAKATCSQANLDTHATCSPLTLEAKTNCSWAILEAKTTCSMGVKKAKTTRSHMVQEAKATCSKAISEVEAHRALQAELLHREHGSIMQDLEGQVIQEETRSQDNFLSTCQVVLYNSAPELKKCPYHFLLHLIGANTSIASTFPSTEDFPVEEQPTTAAPSHQCPNSLIGPKDGTLCQILWRAHLWVEPLRRLLWEDPQLQEARDLSLVQNTHAKLCQGI